MAELSGFWSYVRADDDAEGGRICRLANDIVTEYEMQTGEEIFLFTDKVDIHWGEDWQKKIDENLTFSAFFIPVITPRYFKSVECRRELQVFARKAIDLGIKELILPLLYIDVPSFDEANSSEELTKLIKEFQWEDWRELRFEEPHSKDYRKGVAQLAERLVHANEKADQADIASKLLISEKAVEGNIDETAGSLDSLANAESALSKLAPTLEAISEDISLIGKMMEDATESSQKSDLQGKGFAGRLIIARDLSQKLREPVERIWANSDDFASQMHQVDGGMRIIIDHAPEEIRMTPESQPDICDFFKSIREFSAAAATGLGSTQSLIDSIRPIENMSRDLRPPLKRLKQGLSTMVEAVAVINDWVRLIDDSGVDCSNIGRS